MSNYLFGIKFNDDRYPIIDKIFLYEGALQFNNQQITGITKYIKFDDTCHNEECDISEADYKLGDETNEAIQFTGKYVLHDNTTEQNYYGNNVRYVNGVFSPFNKIDMYIDIFEDSAIKIQNLFRKKLFQKKLNKIIQDKNVLKKKEEERLIQERLLQEKKDRIEEERKKNEAEIQRIKELREKVLKGLAEKGRQAIESRLRAAAEEAAIIENARVEKEAQEIKAKAEKLEKEAEENRIKIEQLKEDTKIMQEKIDKEERERIEKEKLEKQQREQREQEERALEDELKIKQSSEPNENNIVINDTLTNGKLIKQLDHVLAVDGLTNEYDKFELLLQKLNQYTSKIMIKKNNNITGGDGSNKYINSSITRPKTNTPSKSSNTPSKSSNTPSKSSNTPSKSSNTPSKSNIISNSNLNDENFNQILQQFTKDEGKNIQTNIVSKKQEIKQPQETTVDKMEKFLRLYVDIIRQIIYIPVIFKLSSLKCDKFKKLFLRERIFTTEIQEKGTTQELSPNDKLEMSNKLIDFMFINLTSFQYNKNENDDISKTKQGMFHILFEYERGTVDYQDLLLKDKYKLSNTNYKQLKNKCNPKNENDDIIEDNKIINEDNQLIIYILEYIQHIENIQKGGFSSATYINNLYIILYENIVKSYESLEKMINTYLNYLLLDSNQDFRNTIEEYLKEANDDNIITFLKLRNDNDNEKIYNDRFHIKLGGVLKNNKNISNKLMIEYMDDNFPYYDKDINQLSDEMKYISKMNEGLEEITNTNTQNFDKQKVNYYYEGFTDNSRIGKKEHHWKSGIIIKQNDIYYIQHDNSKSKVYIKLSKRGTVNRQIIYLHETGIWYIGMLNKDENKKYVIEYEDDDKTTKVDTNKILWIVDENEDTNKDNIEKDFSNLKYLNFNNYNIVKNTNILTIQNYKYKYLFGEFSNIFTPELSNKKIAEEMDIIKNKIKENKPVFMIGYGASGSGKTSSLIYFNKGNGNQRDGILIHICNQLGETDGYSKIELKCKEFYHTTNVNTIDEPMIVNIPSEEKTIKFQFKNNQFVLTEEYIHVNHHHYRMKNENSIEDITFKEETPLGEVMIHMIDKDRFVKATTNNPNSSRSHTLVFVKLIGEENNSEKIGHIIVGDLAGVENTFECKNEETKKAFLNINRDDGKGIPYYSTETYVGNPDPVGNEQNGGKLSPDCEDKIGSTDPMYDIMNPVYRDTWNLSEPLKIYYTQENNKNLKMAFDIVLKYLRLGHTGEEQEFKRHLNMYKNIIKNGINNFKGYEQYIRKILPSCSHSYGKLTFHGMYTLQNEKYIKQDKTINLPQAISKNQRLETKLYEDLITSIKLIFNEHNIDYDDIDYHINNVIDIKSQFINSQYHTEKDRNGTCTIYNTLLQSVINSFKDDFDIVNQFKTEIGQYNSYLKQNIDNLKTNIFKSHGSFPNLLELITSLKEETACRNEVSDMICTNRREEGYFINQSLKEVREVIKKILYEKNKDIINITPNFIDACFKKYCANNKNCFEFDNYENEISEDISEDTTGSVIFDEIYNELKYKYNSTEQMYKDIIISIFCVFNISRAANNPPPIPYLDINNFKSKYYFEKFTDTNKYQSVKEFILEWKKIYKQIVKKENYVEYFKNDKWNSGVIRDYNTLKIEQMDGNGNLINKFVEGTLREDIRLLDVGSFLGKISIGSKLNDFNNSINTLETNLYGIINNKRTDVDTKEYVINFKVRNKELIISLIDAINNNNAASAIGTIEFLDQISKFNLVKNMCNINDDDNTSSVDKIIKSELYNISQRGGSHKKKYTKRFQRKIQKRKRTRRNKI
jgi:hypothetical protein